MSGPLETEKIPQTTLKHTQAVVGQVGSRSHGPLEMEPRGLLSDGQSPEMSGLSALHTKK